MANFSKYMNDIVIKEYTNIILLTSSLEFNNLNKSTEFNIDFRDVFCTLEFQYFIALLLTKAEGWEYLSGDNLKFCLSD